MAANPDTENDNLIWAIGAFAVLFIGILILMGRYKAEINYAYAYMKVWETRIVDFIPHLSAGWENGVRRLAVSDLSKVDFWDISAFFNRYLTVVWVPVFLWMAWKIYSLKTFYRRYTPQTLLERGALMYPAVQPFVHRNILDEHWNVGRWRLADTPLQFLIRHRLIFDEAGYPFYFSKCYLCPESESAYETQIEYVDEAITKLPREMDDLLSIESKIYLPFDSLPLKKPQNVEIEDTKIFSMSSLTPIDDSVYLHKKNTIDERRLRILLENQIGERLETSHPFASLKKQSAWIYNLAVSLYAHGASDDSKKKTAVEIFDMMNNFFAGSTPWKDIAVHKMPTNLADDFLRKMPPDQHREFREEVLAKHGYWTGTFIMSLLMFARKRGVVPCSNFAWIRYYDRSVWYAMSQTGGRAAYMEGAGTWSHFYAEEYAVNPLDIQIPYVEIAIEGIKNEMRIEGWIS